MGIQCKSRYVHEDVEPDQPPTGSRMVTNSSAAVGWMPTVASNTALVAPALSATAKSLHDLASIGANHVNAQHAVGSGVDDQFHQRALAAATQCVFQRPEFERKMRTAPPLRRALGFGQPTVPMLDG